MRLRAYRVCLDPTPAQLQLLAQHAGAQRWAFNWALAAKVGAHKQLVAVRHELAVARGVDPEDKVALRALTREAATLVPKIPTAIDNLAAWRKVRGDERTGEDRDLALVAHRVLLRDLVRDACRRRRVHQLDRLARWPTPRTPDGLPAVQAERPRTRQLHPVP